jgi:hypothetical protein
MELMEVKETIDAIALGVERITLAALALVETPNAHTQKPEQTTIEVQYRYPPRKVVLYSPGQGLGAAKITRSYAPKSKGIDFSRSVFRRRM